MIKSEINEKNTVSLSGYFSNDKFDYYREQAFNYGNMASTLKWEHSFSRKLSAQFYAILSNYRYRTDMNQDSVRFSSMSYLFNQKILRADFLYYATGGHKLEFGIDASHYSLSPGVRKPIGDYSLVLPKELEKERAAEPSLYFSDEFEVSPLLLISGGLRATLFTAFGPKTEFQYNEGVSRTT